MTQTTQELDTIIGKRVRLARTISGKTQQELATFLDITFQQVQKYEIGKNRVSASSLRFIAEFTGQSIEWFYKAIQTEEALQVTEDTQLLLCLSRAFISIKSPTQRKRVLSLIQSMVEENV